MMTWVRAIWLEDGTEEEGTVPSTWIRDNYVMWPNTTNALKYMISGKVPTTTWRMFTLVKEKLRSESREECEACTITTSAETEDEDIDVPKRQRVKKKSQIVRGLLLGR
ncbi:uncharacterized protein LOC117341225 [Pecten maximus]|uniref:uncharacterized protein LOC117341225 n=1 Tax=Pecten maximus TaxID=6579 RepID=UPI0014585FA2|nr:uncharacterized protein LOC117341225 [Pecten maximus]